MHASRAYLWGVGVYIAGFLGLQHRHVGWRHWGTGKIRGSLQRCHSLEGLEDVREQGRERWIGFGFRFGLADRAGAPLQRDTFRLRYGT
jgi:hypothetical protein